MDKFNFEDLLNKFNTDQNQSHFCDWQMIGRKYLTVLQH